MRNDLKPNQPLSEAQRPDDFRSRKAIRRAWRRRGLAGLAFCCALALVGVVQAQIPPLTRADRGEAFVPDPSIIERITLGFDAVLSDYYWLVAIQAVGGSAAVDANAGGHVGQLIDVVTTLNPWVGHPYRFAAVWLTESEENVRTANRLLERGINHHPEEWRNRFYLGFNLFYYLMEYESAAEQIQAASGLPGAPAYLPRLVARLRSETAEIDVAEAFLIELVQGTDDPVLQEGYRAGLDEIEIERKARFLDEARKIYRDRRGQDIATVESLREGPNPVLVGLPSPEPDSLPVALSRQSRWLLDDEQDEIVSSFYGSRYRLHFDAVSRAKANGWAAARQEGTLHAEERGSL
ncbi:MAG: hypothetical protein CBC48_16215 [bacterium TMED88]|nr:hypothetical protein [Deltaproteobacteria bacterium]OUV25508.1 MAG: hypothetical protein CBC48_16215 [bacterium TMED88]